MSTAVLQPPQAILDRLLSIPALRPSQQDLTALLAARERYNATVADLVASWDEQTRSDCVDWLLAYFNADNFTGELRFYEADASAVLRHFHCSEEEELPGHLIRHRHGRHGSIHHHNANQAETNTTTTTSGNLAEKVGRLPPATYRQLMRALTMDGEAVHPGMRHATLLAAAVAVAETLPVANVWRLRAYFRYQMALQRRSHTLFVRCHESIVALTPSAATTTANTNANDAGPPVPQPTPLLLVECANILCYFSRHEDAVQMLERAQRDSGLRIAVEPSLGVRTKHQQNEVAQLLLNASSSGGASAAMHEQIMAEALARGERLTEPVVAIMGEADGHELFDRPHILPRDNKTPAGELVEEAVIAATPAPAANDSVYADNPQPLHVQDQVLLLAMCQQLRHASASVAHTQHIAQIYIERLVIEENTKASWLLRSAVLLQRSRQEQRRSRVQQRAFLQMQELLDGFDARHGIAPEDSRVAEAGNATSATTTAALDVAKVGATRLQRTRAPYLYAIAWPAVWQLRNEFAEQCFEDNLFKTALDLYEHTMDWPNIIKCCQKLDRRNKAANLARDLLEDDPHDAMLWVALGEATRDEAHLWKAWEVCERKMAAPMRALARLALERERYEDVTKYFDMSVSVNPIFGGDWFALGYASLRTKKGDRACEAFTRVCQLDPEDAYAWTNLGALLLEKKQARPAFNALSQALRNNRMSWKMWDNYLQVAVELLEITESSHSYNILLNMAPRTYPMDGVILGKFVAGCLRYIQGDIYSTQNDEALARDALEAAALEATGGKANTTDLNAEDEALLAEAGVAPVAAPTPAPANAPTAIIETRVEASRSGPEAVLTIASNGGGEQTSSVFDTLKIAPFRTAPKMMDAVESAVAGEAAVTSVSAAGIGAGFGRALAGVGEDDEEAEDDVFEMAELQPFFAEFDDVDPAIYKTAYQTSKSVSEDVRQRFTNRTRELLTRIASVYHDSPAVHACNATFFGTLDGPAAAFDHRVKELRERTAVNLWERDEEKFRGVVQCLEALVVAAVAPPLPSTGEAAAGVAGSQSATEEAAAGSVMATATIATRKKAAQQHISHVLEVTQSHMETNQLYRKLQALSMKLKRAKD